MTESATPGPGASGELRRPAVPPILRLVRPSQWVKNAFVLAPLLFSGRILEREAQIRAAGGFLAFCLLASAVYVLNDLVDRDADRNHPTKRRRPIASGEVSVRTALLLSLVLLAAGLAMAGWTGRGVLAYGATYLVLNLAYSWRLKHLVIIDVFAIAAFFVLRLLAGAAAVAVRPSIWLVLCGGLLALFLGFAKRRHELVLLGEARSDHRAVLGQYSVPLLDQLSVVLLAVTIVSYIMYTRDSETAHAVGGDALTYSTAFVLYGVIRYLHLVHSRRDGNPTDTLLTDRGLLAAVALWVLYCGAVLYWFA